MATTDDFPAEVVHQIFSNLNLQDVAATRLVGRRYADIGAEYLVTRVRFFTEKGSLQRLRDFAKHPGMFKGIKTVVYEGNLLGNRCYHEYRDHFREDHHTTVGGLPQQPPPGSSARSLRLYSRNSEKWEAGIKRDFDEYLTAYAAQRNLLDSKMLDRVLASSTAQFLNLENIQLTTASRCGHNLSKRYSEKYKLSCAMPMEMCSIESTHQLQSLIFPKSKPLLGLKTLKVSTLSPKAFASQTFRAGALKVFQSLKTLELVFRLERDDRYDLHTNHGNGVATAYKDLTNGVLQSSLAAAKDLESLVINFDDLGYFGSAVNVSDILGDTVWPKLHKLDLDCMNSSGRLVDMLRRQPCLKHLNLSFMVLERIDWVTLLRSMKKKLSLASFSTRGLLEDDNSQYNVYFIDSDAYCAEHIEISMSDMLEDFVVFNIPGPDDDDLDKEVHPLLHMDWADPEELYELHGFPDDYGSDMAMSEMSEMSEMSDISEISNHDNMDVD